MDMDIFLRAIESGILYTLIGAILVILPIIIFRRRQRARIDGIRRVFVVISAVFGILSFIFFIQPYFQTLGLNIFKNVDPAYYFGQFALNPLDIAWAYWGSVRLAAPIIATVIAVGFFIVLSISSALVTRSKNIGIKVGLIGGGILIFIAFIYGLSFPKMINSGLSILLGLVVLLSYPASAYFLLHKAAEPVDLEKKVLEYIRTHDYHISISKCAAELGYNQESVRSIISSLERKKLI